MSRELFDYYPHRIEMRSISSVHRSPSKSPVPTKRTSRVSSLSQLTVERLHSRASSPLSIRSFYSSDDEENRNQESTAKCISYFKPPTRAKLIVLDKPQRQSTSTVSMITPESTEQAGPRQEISGISEPRRTMSDRFPDSSTELPSFPLRATTFPSFSFRAPSSLPSQSVSHPPSYWKSARLGTTPRQNPHSRKRAPSGSRKVTVTQYQFPHPARSQSLYNRNSRGAENPSTPMISPNPILQKGPNLNNAPSSQRVSLNLPRQNPSTLGILQDSNSNNKGPKRSGSMRSVNNFSITRRRKLNAESQQQQQQQQQQQPPPPPPPPATSSKRHWPLSGMRPPSRNFWNETASSDSDPEHDHYQYQPEFTRVPKRTKSLGRGHQYVSNKISPAARGFMDSMFKRNKSELSRT